MPKKLTVVERGWGGHFICSSRCNFRRNTLITDGVTHIIVSTVGNMVDNGKIESIGYNKFPRYYETMIFEGALTEDNYIDQTNPGCDYTNYVLDGDWYIEAKDVKSLPKDVDNLANDMHERAVKKTRRKFKQLVEKIKENKEDV